MEGEIANEGQLSQQSAEEMRELCQRVLAVIRARDHEQLSQVVKQTLPSNSKTKLLSTMLWTMDAEEMRRYVLEITTKDIGENDMRTIAVVELLCRGLAYSKKLPDSFIKPLFAGLVAHRLNGIAQCLNDDIDSERLADRLSYSLLEHVQLVCKYANVDLSEAQASVICKACWQTSLLLDYQVQRWANTAIGTILLRLHCYLLYWAALLNNSDPQEHQAQICTGILAAALDTDAFLHPTPAQRMAALDKTLDLEMFVVFRRPDFGSCVQCYRWKVESGGGRRTLRGCFRVCGACNISSYCSRDCQKAHWKASHRAECSRIVEKSALVT